MVKVKVFITDGVNHKNPPDAGLYEGRTITVSRVPFVGEKLCDLSDTETMDECHPDSEVVEVFHVTDSESGQIVARLNVKALG